MIERCHDELADDPLEIIVRNGDVGKPTRSQRFSYGKLYAVRPEINFAVRQLQCCIFSQHSSSDRASIGKIMESLRIGDSHIGWLPQEFTHARKVNARVLVADKLQ